MMTILKFFGIALIGEVVLISVHFFFNGQLVPRWTDIPSLAAIMFGVSPYGQACYGWVKDKFWDKN